MNALRWAIWSHIFQTRAITHKRLKTPVLKHEYSADLQRVNLIQIETVQSQKITLQYEISLAIGRGFQALKFFS